MIKFSLKCYITQMMPLSSIVCKGCWRRERCQNQTLESYAVSSRSKSGLSLKSSVCQKRSKRTWVLSFPRSQLRWVQNERTFRRFSMTCVYSKLFSQPWLSADKRKHSLKKNPERSLCGFSIFHNPWNSSLSAESENINSVLITEKFSSS